MAKIAFIGLGNMGGPMAANLAKAQHHVMAFDLSDAAVSAGRVCSPASAWNRAMTASTFSSARGPERSAAPSAACSSSIFALGTKAWAIPAHTASAALRR